MQLETLALMGSADDDADTYRSFSAAHPRAISRAPWLRRLLLDADSRSMGQHDGSYRLEF